MARIKSDKGIKDLDSAVVAKVLGETFDDAEESPEESADTCGRY